MSARTHADPAPATPVAGAGSRHPGPVLLMAVAVLLTALVQGFLLQSVTVTTDTLDPLVRPGDRVLVWKAPPAAGPGDLVVLDTTDGAQPDRATSVDDAVVGRSLSAIADAVGVDIGMQHRLAVVESATATEVTLADPRPGVAARGDVVGTAFLRIWPLGRFGPVDAGQR